MGLTMEFGCLNEELVKAEKLKRANQASDIIKKLFPNGRTV